MNQFKFSQNTRRNMASKVKKLVQRATLKRRFRCDMRLEYVSLD